MPKYTHDAGDDKGGGKEPVKKHLNLDKYSSGPDMNIRDSFWAIMAAYATKKNMKNEVKIFSHSKVALSRIAISILENPESAYRGLSPNFVSLYTLMMMLDGEWSDEFKEFLCKIYTENISYRKIVRALKKLLAQKDYREQIINYFRDMIYSPQCSEATLAYMSEIKDKPLVESMKKELIIIARNDIDLTQRNAMSCLFLLNDQPDVILLLSQLLVHWNELTREHAANLLKNTTDAAVLRIVKSQFEIENNPKIKKLLAKIIDKNENQKTKIKNEAKEKAEEKQSSNQ